MGEIKLGLSYDDVLLIPRKSDVITRKEISTKTRLTKNITLNIPIVGANMDTVTESRMAIALAELGGIGIIHRFNTIEDQVREVRKVKRFRNAVIEKPFTINIDADIDEALDVMGEHNVKSLLVLDGNGKLSGILTSRDIRFKRNGEDKIRNIMTSRDRLIIASKDISVKRAEEIMIEKRVEKLPLIDENYNLYGLITKKDIDHVKNYPLASLDRKGRLRVGAAIGVKSDSLQRAEKLVEAGVDVLVIDIAHGHSKIEVEMLRKVKEIFPHVDIIAGNVCTAEAVHDLFRAGADAIKVGVGPGSICTTRIVTGCGFPQLSAVIDCYGEAEKYNIPIIADGGIKNSGDIVKAIAAGASTVMLGRFFAGTDESPGNPIVRDGKKFKVIRGMASLGAKLGRESRGNKEDDVNVLDFVPEGVEAFVPYKGSVLEIVKQLIGGLKSGISYGGCKNLEDLRGKGEFVRITSSGMRESRSHDVDVA